MTNRLNILLLFLCLLSIELATAQSLALQQAYVNKSSALQQGDTSLVVKHSSEISELIQQEFPNGGETYVSYTYDLATSYQQIGAFEKAVKWYQTTVEQYKLLYGKNHEYVGITLYNLGGIYEYLNDFEKCREYLQAGLYIIRGSIGRES